LLECINIYYKGPSIHSKKHTLTGNAITQNGGNET